MYKEIRRPFTKRALGPGGVKYSHVFKYDSNFANCIQFIVFFLFRKMTYLSFMKVKRIVVDINTMEIARARRFYNEVLGLDLLMDLGWIATYGLREEKMSIQISFASQGGSGTPTPDLSIEVDDIDIAFNRVLEAGFSIEYGPVNEPWGVRRFYTRDPFGKLVNILAHIE